MKQFGAPKNDRATRGTEESLARLVQQQQKCEDLYKVIQQDIEKTFYSEFATNRPRKPVPKRNIPETIEEVPEDNLEDIEQEEQEWFDEELKRFKQVNERRAPERKQFKDTRTMSSSTTASDQNPPPRTSSARYRKRLDEARQWTSRHPTDN